MWNRVADVLRAVWFWTGGALPGLLVLPGLLPSWSGTVRVDSLPIEDSALPEGQRIDLVLGRGVLLEKRLSLPVAARANLTKAIDLTMRQTLPGGGKDILWRHGAGKRDKAQLSIPVYLLKASALAQVQAVAAQRGSRLRLVAMADDATVLPFWDDRAALDRPRRLWAAVMTGLAAALVIVLVWQERAQTAALDAQLAALTQRKAALTDQAVSLRARLETESSNFAAIARDVALFQAEYHRLPILLDLTEALGDDTWVSELALTGEALRLSGFGAGDVTDVMATIRALPWVQRVDLDGPVSFDSFSRRNRFDLSVAVRAMQGGQP